MTELPALQQCTMTAPIATELHQLATARQEAETDHRSRLASVEELAHSLMGSISDTDLNDTDLRAAVASLPGNGAARILLHAWAQRVNSDEFDLSLCPVPVPVRVNDDE